MGRPRKRGPKTPAGKRRSTLNATKHGAYSYLTGGLLPNCKTCFLADVCPAFDREARRCGLFEPMQAERIRSILALPHIRESDTPLVILFVRNTVFLDVVDLWISRVGILKGEDLQSILKVRWTIDNCATRQAGELGLTPASRKALGLDKKSPPRDITHLAHALAKRASAPKVPA